MPVHEDEHARKSVRRSVKHGTGDHFAGTNSQAGRSANSAYARAEQVGCDRPVAAATLIRSGGEPGAPKQKHDPLKRFAVSILPSRRNFSHDSFLQSLNRWRRISPERFKTVGRVVPSVVGIEGIKTHRRIVATARNAIERLSTKGRVVNTVCEPEEGVSSLSRVPVRIASIRGRDNRLRSGQKHKASEHQRDQKSCNRTAVTEQMAHRISNR